MMHREGCATEDMALAGGVKHWPMPKRVILHPVGHRYDITDAVTGERLVSRARDPEHDLARVLLGRGETGIVETVDSVTGKPRMRFDIEHASKSYVEETRKHGPRLRRWREYPRENAPGVCAVASPASVCPLGGMDAPVDAEGVLAA